MMPPKKKTPKRIFPKGKATLGSAEIVEGMEAVIEAVGANPDAPSIHASSVALLMSPVDFMLIISQFDTTPEGPTMRKAATVFFSPGHAKQLSMILTQKVAEHEEQFGEISPKFFAGLSLLTKK